MRQYAEITIVGRAGKNPELRVTPTGLVACRFSAAVTERVKNGEGWEDGNTTWYEVKCWRALAEAVGDGIRKGDPVVVTGTFQIEQWKGQDGNIRQSPTITASSVGVVPQPAKDGRPARREEEQQAPW